MKYPCRDCDGTGVVPNSSSNTGASKCLECKVTGKTNEAPRIKEDRPITIIDSLSYKKGDEIIIFEQRKNGDWIVNDKKMTNLEVMEETNKLLNEGWK